MSEQGKQYEPRRICAGDGVEVWAWYAGGSDPSGPYELPAGVFAELVPPVVPGWPDAVTFPSREAAIAALERTTRKDERDANANLIAAAPDLLAACETVAVALQWHAEQDPTSTLAGALHHLTAAIRKARGQS